MSSTKVLLTYKRKRFLSQSKLANGIKVDECFDPPGEVSSTSSTLTAQFHPSNKKLNENNPHCFKCSTVDVNQNVLVCDGCCGTYHLECIDPSSKFILEGQWQCSACGKRCDFEEPMQIGISTECNNVEELGTSPMKLPSTEAFQQAGLSVETAQVDSPSKAEESTYKFKEDKLPDNSGDCVLMANKNPSNDSPRYDVNPRGNISFLTFSRRVKKKQVVVKESSDKTSKVVNKQSLMVDQCRNKLEGGSKIPDLFILSDDLLGQAEDSPLHELLPNVTVL